MKKIKIFEAMLIVAVFLFPSPQVLTAMKYDPQKITAKTTIQENLTFRDVWIYSRGPWGEFAVENGTLFLLIIHFGTCGRLFVKYRGDNAMTVARDESGRLIYNYTGKHAIEMKVFRGWFNPGIFKGAYSTAIGFCRELTITPIS